MPNVFDPEGQQNQGAAAQDGEKPKGPAYVKEGEPGQYMQYDNEAGAMILNLPPRFAKYKGDLQEDLMDAFYGEAAGGNAEFQRIDEWIADWIQRKEAEDPDMRSPDVS